MTETPANAHLRQPIFTETAALDSTSCIASVPNFNGLARIYSWLEYLTFGPFLWRCRTRFLSGLMSCRHALILGDGDGRFTARLLRESPEIQIHAVDVSPRMIESLRHASRRNAGRLTTEVADIRAWKPATFAKYDLVVTHFFLDCLATEEVAALSGRLTPALDPNTLWLVSEFAIPPTVFGHIIAAPLVAALYRAFRLITHLRQQSLPDHPNALTVSGWAIQQESTQLFGLLHSQLWRFPLPDSESQLLLHSST